LVVINGKYQASGVLIVYGTQITHVNDAGNAKESAEKTGKRAVKRRGEGNRFSICWVAVGS
jgi:hypothetical protein